MTRALAGVVDGRRHRLQIRIYYEDTDVGGVVYYANYLKFCERGRSDFLRCLGIDQVALMEEAAPTLFVVRRAEVDYLKPARLDDVIEVVTELAELRSAALTMNQTICRGGDVLARARILVAAVSRDGRPRRIPGSIRHILNMLVCSDAPSPGQKVAEGKDKQ